MKNKNYILGLAACAIAAIGFAGLRSVAFADDGTPPGSVPVNGACQMAADCASGLNCNYANQCVPLGTGGAGQPCEIPAGPDAACSGNLTCQQQFTGYSICNVSGTAPAGSATATTGDASCSSTPQCASSVPGSVCDLGQNGGECVPDSATNTGTAGSPCSSSNKCAYNFMCSPSLNECVASTCTASNLGQACGMTSLSETCQQSASSGPQCGTPNEFTGSSGSGTSGTGGSGTASPATITQPASASTPLTSATSGSNCAANGSSTTICNPLPDATIGAFVVRMITYILSIIAAVAVVMIVIAGFRMVADAGNEEAAKKALTMIKNAVIGLAIAVLAYAAIAIITNVLKGF